MHSLTSHIPSHTDSLHTVALCNQGATNKAITLPSSSFFPLAAHCADILQAKPTEIDILTHVCQKAGDKWPAVCTCLGVPLAKIQTAQSNNRQQEEDACFEAVMYWRNGNTTVAVSWLELLKALKSAGLSDVSDSTALQKGVEPVSGCSIYVERGMF